MDLLELMAKYNTEKKCRRLLEQLRWPNGVACARCGNIRITRITTRHTFRCLECEYVFSVTSGTALHNTHIPLRTWLIATYLMCESKKGMSAAQLQRMLGVTYKTAWYLNHRIRNCLQQPDQLTGIIEADETYIGGRFKGKGKGFHRDNKTMVLGLIERKGRAILKVQPDRNRATLHTFILDHTYDIAALYTDGWQGYDHLPNRHKVNHASQEYVRGVIHTNTIEGTWSILKRSIRGTFHYVSSKHLDLYLNELSWRINNNKEARLWLFTLEQLVSSPHLSYEELTS